MAEQVRALREPGLGFLPESLRLYPNRELAAHVVGFEGAEGGLEGVERAFNTELAGAAGQGDRRAGRARPRGGRAAPCSSRPLPGHGVMLTIDSTIQYIAEREIDAAYRRTHAKAAMAVVLEPRTGDVLAMAMRPTFNPNTFLDVPSADYWRNRAVTDPFEPGSTFKAILAAAALEEGVVKPDDRIYGRERRDHPRRHDDPRLEEVRLAHLRRSAAELVERRARSRWAWRSAASATTAT